MWVCFLSLIGRILPLIKHIYNSQSDNINTNWMTNIFIILYLIRFIPFLIGLNGHGFKTINHEEYEVEVEGDINVYAE